MNVRTIGKILALSFAGLVLLVLLAMLGVKIMLDRAPRYQAEIKDWVYAQTGYHIGFRQVSPAFRWYGPELYFDRLELRSKDDQRVLARAAGGRIGADVWQLFRSGKLLAGRIEIDSPSIAVARLGPSRFAVASEIELGGENSSLEALNVEDLPAGRMVIRHAVLTMQNWNAELPQLTLQDVNIDLSRDAHYLELTFNAKLPAVLGGTVALIGSGRGSGDVHFLTWTVEAGARGIVFSGWRRLLPEYLANLESGTGSFEITASGVGLTLSRTDVDFGALNLATQLGDGPITKFDQLSGVLAVAHSGDRWSLTGKNVRVGRKDPESAFDASWREGDGGLLDLRAQASYLRAETLLPLTGFLPQKDIRERLREIAPSGEWTNTSIALARDQVGDPWRMQVQGRFQRAGYAPVAGVPGLRGIAGSIAGNESGGRVIIDTKAGVFNWPSQFPQPIELKSLTANLYWKRTAQELLIASPDWAVKSSDGEVRGQFAWRQPAGESSPVLTLVGNIQNGNAGDARNFMPRGLIAPSALAWLNRAFVAGRMPRADLLFQGPVWNFPFRDGSGIFIARCSIEGMTLDYSEGWPPVENLAVNAEFRNEGMSAHLQSGYIGDLSLESGDARFPDFNSGELKIHAVGRGDAGGALNFLRATPLNEIAEHAFSSVDAKGALRASVDLYLPLREFANRQVLIRGHLDGATVNQPGSAMAATNVSGDFDIDGGQVARADIRGQLLGGPFQMQARAPRNRPVTRTQLEFRGTASADAVRTALSIPSTVSVNGQADWRAVLKVTPEPARERTLRVSSTLAGFEMRLPAPLDKLAAVPMPSWVEIQWPAAGGAQGSLALGNLVTSSFALESSKSGMRLAHASMTFGAGESAAAGTQIVDVGGSVQRVDLAGWLRLLATDQNGKPLAYYMRTAKLNVAELDYLGLVFHDVSLDLTAADRSWRINVGGPNVVGSITVPSANGAAEPWSMQFDRLHFDVADSNDSAADGTAKDAPALADPRAIPAINFRAREVISGGRQIGDVSAVLTRVDDGVSLKSLAVIGRSFTVNAKGEWRGKDSGVSRIQGTLASVDVQSTLKDLGYADVIQAKSGKMDFDLSWAGAPTLDAFAQAAGHVQLSLDKGQVLGVKPGAGRVLGLASIAALPRHLALDFSDLTDKGLAFDTVRGDFELRDGNAYTENVLLKGPAAEIGLIGRVGLKNKDYDQTAVVTTSVGNSLSIPVASALVGGPVVGAAVLLFTQVFKEPLKGLARGYYRITGGWDNPTVERIKSAGAPAAAAETPK